MLGRRLRRRDQRGASAVEFALVVPVLALMVFGMCEFGIGFNNLNSIRQGTREGARQAVVANFGTNSTCSLTGAPTNTELRRLMCLTKDRVQLSSTSNIRVSLEFEGDYEPGNSIRLCTMYPLSSVTGMFAPLLNGRVITTEVEMRVEQIDEDLAAGSETALSGQTWTFCG
jgi:Flp pilus assembly protein TadG